MAEWGIGWENTLFYRKIRRLFSRRTYSPCLFGPPPTRRTSSPAKRTRSINRYPSNNGATPRRGGPIIDVLANSCRPEARYRTLPSTCRFFLSSLFRSVTSVSVVSISPAMLAAFCRAERTTFSGSMMPALNMSTYLPVLAS